MNHQIKPKERVAAHGEVFTSERGVNAMLDLVKQETERIDSRFLKPACGEGNFLTEILRRKLAVCEGRIKAKQYTQLQYEQAAVQSVSSIYGIELLTDNTGLRLRVPYKIQVLDFQSLAFFFFLFAPRLHHRRGCFGAKFMFF